MKNKRVYSKIAICIFIISTLFSGILWEMISWIALVYIYFINKNNKLFRIRKNRVGLIILLMIVISYVAYQCFALNLSLQSTIRLYGITKTLFAIPIIILMCDRYIKTENAILDVFVLIMILNWLTIVSMVTNIDSLNILGGSRNYLGAINVILFPYVFKFMQQNKYKWIRRLFISTLILLMLFSGSRTLMLTTAISFLATIIFEKKINKKIRYLAILGVVAVSAIFILNLFGDISLLSRGISVFFDRSDAARTGLKYFASQQYEAYTNLEKMIGNGDTIVQSQLKPVHNVFGEVLLCYGKIGLIFWISYLIIWVIVILKGKTANKIYIFLIYGLVMIIGWVQPFLTSGYLFQIMVAFVTMQIYYSPSPDFFTNRRDNL